MSQGPEAGGGSAPLPAGQTMRSRPQAAIHQRRLDRSKRLGDAARGNTPLRDPGLPGEETLPSSNASERSRDGDPPPPVPVDAIAVQVARFGAVYSPFMAPTDT